jgi:UDP-N-acetylmuramoyl-tripeptide--D-alanyl-D-alanine ligase
MAAALDTLLQLGVGQAPGLRPVAVLADMLELGPQSESFHYQLGQKAAQKGCALLFTYGPAAQAISAGAREAGLEEGENFQDMDKLKAALKKHLAPGDIVLVKGSNAMNMGQIVTFLMNQPVGKQEDI